MAHSFINYEPITRERILRYRKEKEEKEEKERIERLNAILNEGVKLLYYSAYTLIKENPHHTNYRVYIPEFSLSMDYQEKGVMETIVEETRKLFPAFEFLESADTSYEFIFVLKDS